jgi:hypothetical protein
MLALKLQPATLPLADQTLCSSSLDAMQGASENRTELYMRYCEGESQVATPQRAKSCRRNQFNWLAGQRLGGHR